MFKFDVFESIPSISCFPPLTSTSVTRIPRTIAQPPRSFKYLFMPNTRRRRVVWGFPTNKRCHLEKTLTIILLLFPARTRPSSRSSLPAEREWLPFHMHQPGWGVGQTWCEILLLERAKVVSPKTASTSFPGIVEAASERTSVLGEEVKKLLNDIPPQQHHHQHDLVGGEREGWAMWCVFLHFHTTVVFYEL